MNACRIVATVWIAVALSACGPKNATIRPATATPFVATLSPVPSAYLTSGAASASALATPSPFPGSAPNSTQFASCAITAKKDPYGNPLWYCPNAPYGYHYWRPPADANGDWIEIEQ